MSAEIPTNEDPKLLKVSLDIDDLIIDTAATLMPMYREAHPASIVEVGHWNKITAENVSEWDARDIQEAVERVNTLLDTPEFFERVPAITGMDRVVRFLAQRAALSIATTGRPELLLASTLAILRRDHQEHYDETNLFFSGYTHDSRLPMNNGGKLGILEALGITHHGDDHLSHAVPIAEAGIHVPLFGHYPWNAMDVADMPPTMVRTGDADALLEYFSDEDRRLLNGDPWDPKTARRFY